MFSGNYAQLMAAYNEWMNDKLYEVVAGIDDAERKRDRGAFFRSIHGTLDHILWGDRAWLPRFANITYARERQGEYLYEDFDELREARKATDRDLKQWAETTSESWLAEPMTWGSRMYGFTQTVPRWVLVTQMFNHQTHHRGQVTTLLRQMGLDVGVTDVPLLPLLEPRFAT